MQCSPRAGKHKYFLIYSVTYLIGLCCVSKYNDNTTSVCLLSSVITVYNTDTKSWEQNHPPLEMRKASQGNINQISTGYKMSNILTEYLCSSLVWNCGLFCWNSLIIGNQYWTNYISFYSIHKIYLKKQYKYYIEFYMKIRIMGIKK